MLLITLFGQNESKIVTNKNIDNIEALFAPWHGVEVSAGRGSYRNMFCVGPERAFGQIRSVNNARCV